MKMSGTKPMKNTMRKASPMKQTATTKPAGGKPNAAGGEKKKGLGGVISSLEAAKAKKAAQDKGATKQTTPTTTKSTPTTKPSAPAGKPNASAKPAGGKAIDAVKKVATAVTKGAGTKTPAMQLKKHKC
jgi:hypothetical protein